MVLKWNEILALLSFLYLAPTVCSSICRKHVCCRFLPAEFFRPSGCSGDWCIVVYLILLCGFMTPSSGIGAYSVVLWLLVSCHASWKYFFLMRRSVSNLPFTLKTYILHMSIDVICALDFASHYKMIDIVHVGYSGKWVVWQQSHQLDWINVPTHYCVRKEPFWGMLFQHFSVYDSFMGPKIFVLCLLLRKCRML